jgi:hypothetical protein
MVCLSQQRSRPDMWLFIASPIISWALCLIGFTVYFTFSDERASGSMLPWFNVVNTILMTWAFYRWMIILYSKKRG